MGLISAAVGAAGGVLADQWKEYFYCESMPDTLLAVKGRKRVTGRGSNTKGNDNLISSGSVIAVADGQCMLIVEQGKVVEVCAEPGEFVFDASTEPSVFAGGLNKESIMAVLTTVGKRIGFGGETAKDQRVYYFNTKELPGFKYGTPGNGIPFRVVDERAGINMSVNIKTHGMYSVRMSNPLLFYTALCGNMADRYERSAIEGQLRAEFLSALQPALARISAKHILYDELPAYTMELGDALNEVLSSKWRERIGIEVVSVGMESVNASAEDEKAIKEMQREAAYMDPTRLAAKLGTAQAQAMTTAAGNRGGAAVGFMGMNMAQNMGG